MRPWQAQCWISITPSKYLVLVGGVEYAPGEIVLTLTTDEHGYASTAADALPYGSYEIVERTAPVGYLNSGVIRQGFRIREHGVIVSMTTGDTVIKNDIIRGNVLIEKWDNEIGEHRGPGRRERWKGLPSRSSTVAWTACWCRMYCMPPERVVYTTVTDETGTAYTPEFLLPYGTFEAREISPTLEGYLSTGVLSRFFEIREHGKNRRTQHGGNRHPQRSSPRRPLRVSRSQTVRRSGWLAYRSASPPKPRENPTLLSPM